MRTVWQSRNGAYALPPITDARARLEALLRLYREGLASPLHFFPKSAWAYVAAVLGCVPPSTAGKARRTTRANPTTPPIGLRCGA